MCLPPLHVWLDVKEILQVNSPWFARSGFKHETTELGMEDGGRLAGPVMREYDCDLDKTGRTQAYLSGPR
jgi:hypothetical protein